MGSVSGKHLAYLCSQHSLVTTCNIAILSLPKLRRLPFVIEGGSARQKAEAGRMVMLSTPFLNTSRLSGIQAKT
jgi:hypothetical protein